MKDLSHFITTPAQEKQLREKPLFETSFYHHCENLGLHCTFSQGIVFIQSSFSHWRIYNDGCFVTKLERENIRRRFPFLKQKHLKCGEGFHQIKLRNKNIYDVAYYIKYRDSFK